MKDLDSCNLQSHFCSKNNNRLVFGFEFITILIWQFTYFFTLEIHYYSLNSKHKCTSVDCHSGESWQRHIHAATSQMILHSNIGRENGVFTNHILKKTSTHTLITLTSCCCQKRVWSNNRISDKLESSLWENKLNFLSCQSRSTNL